jgi:hypothetical protein
MPSFRHITTFWVLALVTAACSASTSPVESSDSHLEANVPANNCEVFVDRAAPHFDSHGVEQLTLYLNTPLGKLDNRGGIKSVGFHAQAIEDGKVGPFTDIVATKFADAQDYWVLVFNIASDFSPTTTFKGTFYVEAKDGARLWVNATEGGPDFLVDSNMVGNLANRRASGFFASSSTTSPPMAIVAADEFPYLNPHQCR